MRRLLIVAVLAAFITGAPTGFDGVAAAQDGLGSWVAWARWRFTGAMWTDHRPAPDPAQPVPLDRADVDACAKVLTLDDHGNPVGLHRWTGPVTVTIDATSVDETRKIQEVLDWVTQVTGIEFTDQVRSDASTMSIVARPGVDEFARLQVRDGRIVHADVSFDPGVSRYRWEEILGAAGMTGDWGPIRSTVTNHQLAANATPFDMACLRALYSLPVNMLGADLATVTAAL